MNNNKSNNSNKSNNNSNNNKSGGSSCSSRVSSIPNNVLKTILHIKEITSNHSEDDIYAVLKECSMDPNETTQRLLHLDTFHEVKSKRDKRKEIVKSRAGEESRWRPGQQARGTRNVRGNSFPQYTSNDAGGQRAAAIRKENGVEESRGKGFRHSPAPGFKETYSIQQHNREKLSPLIVDGPVEPRQLPNGSLNGGRGVQSSRVGDFPSNKIIDASAENSLSIVPKASAENAPSALDPVLVPSCNLLGAMAGSVKKEVQVRHMSAETRTLVPVDRLHDTTESVTDNNLNQCEPQNVISFQVSSSTSDWQPVELVEVAHPEILIECPVAEKSHVSDSVSVVKPSSQGAKDATTKLAKLKFSDAQHVIIPQHIQVPDAVKNVLSFGSIDSSFVVRDNCVDSDSNANVNPVTSTIHEEIVSKLPSCDEDAVSTGPQANHADQPQSPSHSPDKNSPINTEVSSAATIPKVDLPKQETLPAVGPPFPVVQTAPSYSFGFMPPMLANMLVQPEGFESQTHVSNSLGGSSMAMSTSASTPPLTQSAGAGQSSVTVSPQPIPLFRQPFPPNYIPYSHYFSPFYPPPTMHQYYGHTAFPPPLPTSNMYLPPPTAPAGMKISPAHFKPGTNTGHQVPVGAPSGYGSYSNSQVGYSQNAVVTSGNNSNGEDLGPPALKEMFLGQQSEGSAVWIPAAASRDTPNFPLNSFLNIPQPGHHMVNPQSGHGGFAVYHTLQPMGSPAPGLPLLQPSQPVAGSVDSVGPPSNPYQQPQRQQQINWNM